MFYKFCHITAPADIDIQVPRHLPRHQPRNSIFSQLNNLFTGWAITVNHRGDRGLVIAGLVSPLVTTLGTDSPISKIFVATF